MIGAGVEPSVLEYFGSPRLRFLQERAIGIDLWQSGFWGIAATCLLISELTIFSLAIFQVIARRRQTVALLLGVGSLSLLSGVVAAWWNFASLAEARDRIVSAAGGALPRTPAEEAAVLSLPALVGAAALAVGLFGCLYLALFWSEDFLRGSGRRRAKRKSNTR